MILLGGIPGAVDGAVVSAMAVLGDGTTLAVALQWVTLPEAIGAAVDTREVIKLWDSETGALVHTLALLSALHVGPGQARALLVMLALAIV